MSDIVERLRKLEAVERELAHECDMPPEGTANWGYAETCREAAAEIDRLRADYETARDAHDRRTAEVVRLRAALRDLLNASERHIFSTECQNERDAARAALGEKA